ncbi:biliverdin-producing heme oxygenase [Allorhizocola rhizosphaerae]|uniref:biliverdin-producing heme oxygenase n=1 Tax=Allorhizocola rhizosphaerae TaxID=1872709 RepID=UPI000E3DD70B|nr:biliverdin-producing heme oxygenase [Allorhizocola rhizosphaerae]
MDFAARLRAATWDDHSSAERDTFLTELTKGRLSLRAHAAHTAQHYFLYEALERAAAVYSSGFHTPALNRVDALKADLRYLIGPRWREEISPNEATNEYLARLKEIAFTWHAGFVAHHYLRYLGDLSGGQFVAQALARAYGLQLGGDGLRFYSFDRIGDLIAFKEDYRNQLNSAGWDAVEQDRVIDEVRLAYRLNASVLAELGREHRNPFTADVVAQIMRHMNDDHAADSLLICRVLGGVPDATAARMSGMDAEGIEFVADVSGTTQQIRIPFSQRLTERAQVRAEVTRLYHEARGHGS